MRTSSGWNSTDPHNAGHEDAADGSVKNRVTHADYVDDHVAADDADHVTGHALPVVEQESLNFVETGADDGVEQPLAVGAVHHDESGYSFFRNAGRKAEVPQTWEFG